MRKIVHISNITDNYDDKYVIVVCDDGTLWLGKPKMIQKEEKEKAGLEKASEYYMEWEPMNSPPEGEMPWRKRLKFWERMEKIYGQS
jgi:hypothetical protein